MSNFLYEASFEADYEDIVRSICFKGCYLKDYLAPDFFDATKVHTPGFWSSKSDIEDDMTQFEFFSMSMMIWIEQSGLLEFVQNKIEPICAQMHNWLDLDPIRAQMDKGKSREDPGREYPDGVIPDETTAEQMISIVTTDEQDISSFGPSEKEKEFSFVANETNQFWSRPVRVATAVWDTTQARSHELVSFKAFSDVIDAATNYQLKLANSVGLTGTLRVFVIVNATPYQAGGLVLFGSPNADNIGDVQRVMTGPHALIAAGANQTASMDIPYNRELLFSPTLAYTSGEEDVYFDWVKIGVRVLSPLVVASGASTSVNVQVLAQLVDVEIMQGAYTSFALSAQMAGNAQKDSIASATGSMIKTVGGAVDSVSKLAEAGVAMLSKASHTTSSPPIGLSTAHSIANYNGTDDSQKAALNASARTVAHPGVHGDSRGSPTAVKVIGARPGLIDIFEYNGMQGIDAILWFGYVDPIQTFGSLGVANVPSPCSFLASHFALWRGSMSFRFTIFKTAFHSGTLEIMVDYGGGATTPNTASRSVNLHRVYWDITTQSSITVTIPYRRPWHWCQYGNRTFCPILYVTQVQPLVSGDTVYNSVEIIVEHFSSDLQVAWPQRSSRFEGEGLRPIFTPPSAAPFQPSSSGPSSQPKSTAPPAAQRNVRSTKVRPQMFAAFSKVVRDKLPNKQGNFDPAVTTHELADHVLLGDESVIPSSREEFAYRYIAGEEVTDVLQVVRRFMNLSNETTGILKEFTYTQNRTTNFTSVNVGSWPMFVESILKLFVYGTGGFRLKIVNARNDAFTVAQVYLPTRGVALPIAYGSGVPELFQNGSDHPALEIEVPNVSQFFYYRLYTQQQSDNEGNRPPMEIECAVATSTATVQVYFALADDVTWGGSNYLPEVILNTPTVVFIPSYLD
jgi:hypothetical protein